MFQASPASFGQTSTTFSPINSLFGHLSKWHCPSPVAQARIAELSQPSASPAGSSSQTTQRVHRLHLGSRALLHWADPTASSLTRCCRPCSAPDPSPAATRGPSCNLNPNASLFCVTPLDGFLSAKNTSKGPACLPRPRTISPVRPPHFLSPSPSITTPQARGPLSVTPTHPAFSCLHICCSLHRECSSRASPRSQLPSH